MRPVVSRWPSAAEASRKQFQPSRRSAGSRVGRCPGGSRACGPGIRAPGLDPAVGHLDHQFLDLPDRESWPVRPEPAVRPSGWGAWLPASRPACGPGKPRGRRSARQGCGAPGRPARWTRAAAASPGCRCRSRWGRRPSRTRRTGSCAGCGHPGAARRARPWPPQAASKRGLHADRDGVLGEPAMASASAISTCSKRWPAARIRCSPTSAAACSRASRAASSPASPMTWNPPWMPSTEQAARWAPASAAERYGCRVPPARPYRLPQGRSTGTDGTVDVQVAGEAANRDPEPVQQSPRRAPPRWPVRPSTAAPPAGSLGGVGVPAGREPQVGDCC